MNNTSFEAFNAEHIGFLKQSLFDYPCHIPTDAQHLLKQGIEAFETGERSPDLLLFLTIHTVMVVANRNRYAVHEAFRIGANSLAVL